MLQKLELKADSCGSLARHGIPGYCELVFFKHCFYLVFSVLPTAYIGVIRGIFIGSAFLWITGSLVSKNKLKIQ